MQQRDITRSLETQPTPISWLLSTLRRHPLLFYFLLAYAISWGIGFPLIVLLHTPASLWLAILVAFAPTASSFIMTTITEGRAGIKNLLRRYIRWRVGILWYLLVMIGFPALIALVSLTLPGGGAAVLKGLQAYPVIYILTFFAGGPFLEEPGWRGFALPRLQQHFGPLWGSLLLGALWGIWHLPLFLIPGYNGSGVGFVGISTALLAFILGTSLLSVIFAWVFNNTRGSLLLVMLLHASINTAGSFVPTAQASLVSQVIMYAVFAAVTLIVIIVTKGQLSYKHYLYETELFSPVPLPSDPAD